MEPITLVRSSYNFNYKGFPRSVIIVSAVGFSKDKDSVWVDYGYRAVDVIVPDDIPMRYVPCAIRKQIKKASREILQNPEELKVLSKTAGISREIERVVKNSNLPRVVWAKILLSQYKKVTNDKSVPVIYRMLGKMVNGR
jgi:uncharacterized protein (UPF0147 family)